MAETIILYVGIIQYFFKRVCIPYCENRTHVYSRIYVYSGERKRRPVQRGRNAPCMSAYRLSVIYFPKFENYTAFNTPLAAGLPPCFIHVAINKEQKTVFCKVTHQMLTRKRDDIIRHLILFTNQILSANLYNNLRNYYCKYSFIHSILSFLSYYTTFFR